MNMASGGGFGGEDRLPWLETVDEEYREGPSGVRTLLLVLLALIVVAAAGVGWWWFQHRQGVTGNGELIEAQEGDYKVKPDEPGGMKVAGEGDSVFATSQGAASNASINADGVPEKPIQGQKVQQAAQAGEGTKTARLAVPAATTAPQPAAAAPRPAAAAPAGSGALIQLGAFPNEAGANTAWARLSKRFGYIAPLGKSVERAESNGKTVWRLRVNAGSNGQARDLCGKLKVAGENCFIAN